LYRPQNGRAEAVEVGTPMPIFGDRHDSLNRKIRGLFRAVRANMLSEPILPPPNPVITSGCGASPQARCFTPNWESPLDGVIGRAFRWDCRFPISSYRIWCYYQGAAPPQPAKRGDLLSIARPSSLPPRGPWRASFRWHHRFLIFEKPIRRYRPAAAFPKAPRFH
jgi:hypothetical protein